MAKRRVRSSPTPITQNVVPNSSSDTNNPAITSARFRTTSLSKFKLRLSIFLASLSFSLFILTYFYRHLINPTIQNSEFSIYESGLVKPHITYEDVLAEAGRPSVNTTRRHFRSTVLAYVTPWNSKGYDMAKKFRAKFTHVSPVWYQLKRVGTELKLLGRHDVDQQWIAEVRKDKKPLILPRVILEASPIELLAKKKERKQVINLIVSECKNMGFDGVVLEAWSVWTSYGILKDSSLRKMALDLLEELGSTLHTTVVDGPVDNLQFVFVIPPPNSIQENPDMFTVSDMARLSNYVDGFSLMTYDFSNAYQPGPNAPLGWVRACLQLLLPDSLVKQQSNGKMDMETTKDVLARKILMGVNFYGNDYVLPKGGGSILGHEYLSLLRIHRPKLVWDKQNMEHYFDYKEHSKKHRVFYPSLQSISSRLEEAQTWGVGLSIWEIGQGLDYFFDLL